ncbi:alpha/beta hydrolase [Actinokineospora sp.]|uniref:alpha/beta hydrolase n=1 Tax=Actinokineospora sp. TaxID=1872133 RepID=UPI003D6C3512
MLPWTAEFAGRIDEHVFASDLLRGNSLGDPHERPLWVYVPPGYDEGDRRYPTVYVIQGYTGHIAMWRNRTPWRQPFIELADGIFAREEAPPAIVVYVDAWTSVGGSQYLDSPGTGQYHSYLCDEVVPWVDEHYRTMPATAHRAITGKSSGGYGAMITPMLRPDLFGALATHAGDALFESTYQKDFPQVARLLRDNYDGSYDNFLADFRGGRIVGTKDTDFPLIETYGYASCYSADEDGTVRIPFDDIGATVPEVWDRWLRWDPVRMAARPEFAEALHSLKAIWIDAGTQDEYYLDFGAVAFRRALAKAGVRDDVVRLELFEGKHGAIEYRYPLALAWLTERIS